MTPSVHATPTPTSEARLLHGYAAAPGDAAREAAASGEQDAQIEVADQVLRVRPAALTAPNADASYPLRTFTPRAVPAGGRSQPRLASRLASPRGHRLPQALAPPPR